MPDPILELLIVGTRHRIYYLCEGNHRSFRDFADDLHASGPFAARLRRKPKVESKKTLPPDWKKLLALLQRAAQHGIEVVAQNSARCKRFVPPPAHTNNERMEVCEFKTGPYRVLFFVEETTRPEPRTTLIITHVFEKKQDETPRGELRRFADLRATYYRWRAALKARDALDAITKCQPPTS
ncbi:MAG: hypothetical protein AAF809_07320 [Bacteroidota bacterium]